MRPHGARNRTRSNIRLADVTSKNWEAIADLSLEPEQANLVASNLFSIAESHFDPAARPRAILASKRTVGFLMYDVHRTRGNVRVFIYRFMIDRKYQGKGYGRAALSAALKEIKAIAGLKKVGIVYMPRNKLAKSLYSSFGFVEVGRDKDGEILAELRL